LGVGLFHGSRVSLSSHLKAQAKPACGGRRDGPGRSDVSRTPDRRDDHLGALSVGSHRQPPARSDAAKDRPRRQLASAAGARPSR
jgi:hypothetical protein